MAKCSHIYRSRIFGFLLVLSVLCLFSAVAAFGAYLAGRYELPPFRYIRAAEHAIFGQYWEGSDSSTLTIVPSVFFTLEIESTTIPRRRKSWGGGGMTTFHEDALLVTHEGRIFSIPSANDVVELSIKPPDNGFEGYARLIDSAIFENLDINLPLLRYNDIAYIPSDTIGRLLLSYTYFDEKRLCYSNRVSMLTIPLEIKHLNTIKANPEDWAILHSTRPCLPLQGNCRGLAGHMAGGRLAFEPPSTLYLASGDYYWDGMCASTAVAQDQRKEYGKILAIDLETKKARIVSMGHRNPQGITVDRDGALWVAEHGMRGGDELNLIVEGKNYGWPLEALGTNYEKLPIASAHSFGRHEIFHAPVFAWLPSPAISSLMQVHGFDETWDGDFLLGSLKAEALFHVRVKDGRVIFSEEIQIGARIRYVHQHPDGRILLWTDRHTIMFLTPTRYLPGRELVKKAVAEVTSAGGVQERLRAALRRCNECHSFEPGDHNEAPSLATVFDAQVASTGYAGYSKALRDVGGRWTREHLRAYISDPGAFAPETTMPNPGINEPEILEKLIDVLAALAEGLENGPSSSGQ